MGFARAMKTKKALKQAKRSSQQRRRYTVSARGAVPLALVERISAIHAAVIDALINTVQKRPAD